MKTGIELIAEERQRQQEKEGWTVEHDQHHYARELAWAAYCYLQHYLNRIWLIDFKGEDARLNDLAKYQNEKPPEDWPFETKAWKPKGKIQDLKRIGAFIAAEIDRLQSTES